MRKLLWNCERGVLFRERISILQAVQLVGLLRKRYGRGRRMQDTYSTPTQAREINTRAQGNNNNQHLDKVALILK